MFNLFAQAVTNAVEHAAEVTTSAEGFNRAMDWPLATLLMVLVGSISVVALASVRAVHSFHRDVANSGSAVNKNKLN